MRDEQLEHLRADEGEDVVQQPAQAAHQVPQAVRPGQGGPQAGEGAVRGGEVHALGAQVGLPVAEEREDA